MNAESSTIGKCKNCGSILQGSICHKCGQRVIDSRWTIGILWNQFIAQLTNIEKGFLYTIKGLIIFPGIVINDYWGGRTVKYYNPFRYVIILIAINLFLSYQLGINDIIRDSMQGGIMDAGDFSEEDIMQADRQFNNWLNVLVLLLIPFNALLTWILFRKHKKNYAEHTIMNTYIIGQQSAIGTIVQFVFIIFPAMFTFLFPINFIIGWVYNSWVYKKTFDEDSWIVILKAFIIGVVGLIVFFILVFIFSTLALALT